MTSSRSPMPDLRPSPRLALLWTVALTLLTTALAASPGHAAKIERVRSPSGIEAWLLPNPATPIIHLRFSFEGGTYQDPADKPGVAYMTAFMFDEGAGDMDTQAFTRARNASAMGLSASAGSLYFSGGFSTHSQFRAKAFDLLRLSFTSPRFDAEPLARARTTVLTQIKRAEGDPGSLVTKAMRERLYPGHRYETAPFGTAESVERITPDDMRAYRSRILTRDTLKISVVGDIDAKTLAPLLDHIFGSLPATGERRAFVAPVSKAAGQQTIDLSLPQAIVRFQRLTRRLPQREEIAASILDSIMSDSLTGRLFVEVREKRGLVYGIGATYNDLVFGGAYAGGFGASNETALNALDVTLEVLAEVAKNGPSDEEVATARRTLVGRRLFAMESSAAIAGTILSMQMDRLPITYLDEISPLIESITREEVAKVAREIIDTNAFHIVIAGRPVRPKGTPPG